MDTDEGVFARLREALINGSTSEGEGLLRLLVGHGGVGGDNHGVINITINQAPPTLTKYQKARIRGLVSKCVKASKKAGKPATHAEVWCRVHDKFGVGRYDEIPASRYGHAAKFLQRIISDYDGGEG